ncbi:hypothetical protein SPBR_02977 [Sporothrix brasiliensis 5110]|uniref:Uncharacterized protein n=1 Tax=Sporothrix brasiliensis 5110 TaxID=1398154 RepID=A0A0C2IZV3_9PEZI|nr:uncharacterized protein SPBR_02977 [Sporothrix brasiliensis 5110]KIH92275.1 hypothetical protein SPBR_02977 [Sporothrix brasiliensis 5110]
MGTEIISATLFFNKLTGAYGLLAILTGYSLSFIQLSAYLYNVAILVLLAICIPHIRRETPLPNLVLAWAYTIDTLINAAYTATFALRWYFASSSAAVAAAATSSAAAVASAVSTSVPATMETASATSDAIVSATASATSTVASTATAASILILRDDAMGTATGSSTRATAIEASPSAVPTAGGGGWMGAHETTASLALIILVTVVRFYFSFVVVAHTRQALQRYGDHVAESAAAADGALDDSEEYSGVEESKYHNGGEGKSERNNDIDEEEAGLKPGSRSTRGRRHRRRNKPSTFPRLRPQAPLPSSPSSTNPFAEGSPAGEGWKGKLGRALVGVGRNFWLGRQKDDDWTRDVNSRFRSSATAV